MSIFEVGAPGEGLTTWVLPALVHSEKGEKPTRAVYMTSRSMRPGMRPAYGMPLRR